jgi:hypothetical protein
VICFLNLSIMKIKETLRKVADWFRTTWNLLKETFSPGRQALLGAAIGIFTIFFLMLLVQVGVLFRYIGWVPSMFIIVGVGLASVLGGLLIDLLLGWINRMRPLLRIALLAGLPVVMMFYSVQWLGALLVFFLAAFSAGMAGGALMILHKRGVAGLRLKEKVFVSLCLFFGLAMLAGGVFWMVHPGKVMDMPPNAALEASALPPALGVPDPSQSGPLKVEYLTYGSGTDKLRVEYREEVAFSTQPVDGSSFLSDWDGIRGRMRIRLFGFGPDSLPLNARVWYPVGEGPFPLVLNVHGNHLAQDWSDPGYEYLGTLLASRGYIFVSVDQNFLNGSHTNLMKGFSNENDARGWLLLKHLEQWKQWSETESHPFFSLADMDRIALIGHSRGGEAVMHAAFFNRLPYYPDNALEVFDFGFNIRSVVAIAPVDGQYQPGKIRTALKDINYFVIQGSHDMDMSSYQGLRPFNRLEFSPGFHGFKAGLYVYGANHGQFNSRWGRKDYSSPRINFFNIGQLMKKEDQMQVARVYLSAFLEATLRGEERYVPLFMDARLGREWLPETIYLNQFEHSASHIVCRFEEDLNLGTTTLAGGNIQGSDLTLWREQLLDLAWGNQDTRAVIIGWNTSECDSLVPRYTIRFPAESISLNSGSALMFSLADAGEKAPLPEKDQNGQDLKNQSAADNFLAEEVAAEKANRENEDADSPPELKDFTIELLNAAGNMVSFQLSRFSPLQPRLARQLTKFKFLQKVAEAETVFQFYYFPLEQVVPEGSPFDASQITSINFVFNISKEGSVVLNNIGFMDQLIFD